MKKKILLLLMVVAPCASAYQWSGYVKIEKILTGYKEGFLLFKTTGNHVNPGSCSNTGYYSIEEKNADVDKALSLLLSAQLGDRKIKVAADGHRCGTVGIQHLENQISVSRLLID